MIAAGGGGAGCGTADCVGTNAGGCFYLKSNEKNTNTEIMIIELFIFLKSNINDLHDEQQLVVAVS